MTHQAQLSDRRRFLGVFLVWCYRVIKYFYRLPIAFFTCRTIQYNVLVTVSHQEDSIVWKITVLACLLWIGGCAGATPGPYSNLWTQCVEAEGWGLSWFTAYGPANFGYLKWRRNVQCEKTSPGVPVIPVPPVGLKLVY